MRLDEEQRKAVMRERDALRPCRTCRWQKTWQHGCREALGCVHSEMCNYAHDGWEPIDNNDKKENKHV